MQNLSRKSIFLCTFIGLTPLINVALGYLEGRSGGHFTLFVLPVILFPFLAMIVCAFAMLRSIGRDMVRGRSVWAKSTLLAVSFVVFTLLVAHTPSYSLCFLKGFRDCLFSRLTEAQMYHIADCVRTRVPEGTVLRERSPGSAAPPPSSAAAWEALAKSTETGLLPQQFAVINNENCVEIEWGSALSGHYGLRIAPDNVERSEYDNTYVPVNERIAAFDQDH